MCCRRFFVGEIRDGMNVGIGADHKDASGRGAWRGVRRCRADREQIQGLGFGKKTARAARSKKEIGVPARKFRVGDGGHHLYRFKSVLR